ncbi:hypothetical protein [Paenibacillus sp. HGF7]|nr:hypothetical protein [Paenibacillus sp. HGF7]
MGYADIKYPGADEWYCIVGIDTKYTPKITVYDLSLGTEKTIKMDKKKFYSGGEEALKVGNLIKITLTEMRQKSKKIDGKWVKIENQFEEWIISCFIKK